VCAAELRLGKEMKRFAQIISDVKSVPLLGIAFGVTFVTHMIAEVLLFCLWFSGGIIARIGFSTATLQKGIAWIAYWPAFLFIGEPYDGDRSFVPSVILSVFVWFVIFAVGLFGARAFARN
jgi:hypothetical protein